MACHWKSENIERDMERIVLKKFRAAFKIEQDNHY